VFFCDDDAWTDDTRLLARIAALFAARPRLGAVQPRIAGPDGTTLRRWVPRARVGDPGRPGPAFNLAEGVTVLRRRAFDELGGWAPEFFYGHEGIDMTWRLWAAGWEVHYAGDLVASHPITEVTRHAVFYRFNARNRVWSARRNLPAPVLAGYLLAWSVLTTARLVRQPRALRTWWAGFCEGWRTPCGPRRPMSWRTVWRLTRLGQPPVI
jgi:GT2 family glycosyltransferase